MYLVTGGAGFIGSNLVAELSARGHEIVVCDWMRSDERWRNLAKHEIAALIEPEGLPAWLGSRAEKLTAVLHMGAISATTETDVDRIAQNNIRATLALLDWCTETQTRLIYASFAATYGDGGAGFDDDSAPEALALLRPLNAYGWSKHVVDRRIARLRAQGAALPPQCVGLKFFNVYGPNEYHKGGMQSVIARNFLSVQAGAPLRLFRSHRPDFADGGQLRDFICVDDCVAMIVWLLDRPGVSGLFNAGTGKARSWRDLGMALFSALGARPSIEYVDMPAELIGKYQYFTEARTDRLRAAGYDTAFTELEAGIGRYVRDFLAADDRYR